MACRGGLDSDREKGECQVRDRVLLVAVCVIVLGSVAALASGPFFGSWTAEIGLSPQQTPVFSSFSSTLEVGLRLGFLEFSSTSDFIFSGWLWEELDLGAALGPLTFRGTALFEPQTGSFLYAQGVVTLDFSPLVFRLYSAMVGPTYPGGLNWGSVCEVYGELLGGDISIDSATLLGADLSGISFTQTSSYGPSKLLTRTYLTDPTIDGPDVCFSGEVITFKALAFGCVGFQGVTTFTQTGFQSQEFELAFLHVFGIPLTVTLDYLFALQTASHTFTPSLETDFGCVRIYSELLGSGGAITGVAIHGVEFRATFFGSTFRSISNLNTTDYVITTPEFGSIVESKTTADTQGHLYYPQSYWEIVSFTTQVQAGGCVFSFHVDTFFGTATGLLFDWAMSDMGVTVGLGDLFFVTTGITVAEVGFTEWSLGVGMHW